MTITKKNRLEMNFGTSSTMLQSSEIAINDFKLEIVGFTKNEEMFPPDFTIVFAGSTGNLQDFYYDYNALDDITFPSDKSLEEGFNKNSYYEPN